MGRHSAQRNYSDQSEEIFLDTTLKQNEVGQESGEENRTDVESTQPAQHRNALNLPSHVFHGYVIPRGGVIIHFFHEPRIQI